jgi:hypothetical protein
MSTNLRGRPMRTFTAYLSLGLLACSEPTSPNAVRIVVPSRAALATLQKTIENAVGATASFARVDGCLGTTTSVTVLQPNTPGSNPTVVLAETVLDVCGGTVLDDIVTLQSSATFSGDLNSGSLNGVVTGQNILGEIVQIPVALTWTGTGATTKARTATIQSSSGTRTVVRLQSSSRNATLAGTIRSQAVAGVFSDVTLFTAAQATIEITR